MLGMAYIFVVYTAGTHCTYEHTSYPEINVSKYAGCVSVGVHSTLRTKAADTSSETEDSGLA